MNLEHIKRKIKLLDHDLEEMEADREILVNELKEKCQHAQGVQLDGSSSISFQEAIICTCCGAEWLRYPTVERGWYKMKNNRPCQVVLTFGEWARYRL